MIYPAMAPDDVMLEVSDELERVREQWYAAAGGPTEGLVLLENLMRDLKDWQRARGYRARAVDLERAPEDSGWKGQQKRRWFGK